MLLTAAVAVRIFCITGLVGEDDHFLIGLAHDLSEGRWEPFPHHQYLRVGILAPLAVVGTATGWDPDLHAAYGFLCSVGLVAVTAEIGRRWFSAPAGLAAGWVMAFYPNDVHYAGVVNVDGPATFWFTLGMLVLWPRRPGLAEPVSAARALAAGLCLGAAYLGKETILLAAAWPAVWIFRDPGSRRRLLVAAAAFAAVVAVESAAYGMQTGDPLLRWHAARVGAEPGSMTTSFTGSALLSRWLWDYPMLMFLPTGYLGVFYPLLALALLFLLWTRQPDGGFVFGGWALPCALILWMPGSFSPPTPALNVSARYLEPVAPPAALLIGLALSRTRRLQPAALALLALHVVTGAAAAASVQQTARAKIAPLREAAAAIGPATVVATDFWSAGQLAVLTRFRPDLDLVEHHLHKREPPNDPGTIVIFYSYGMEHVHLLYGLPAEPSWAPAVRRGAVRVADHRVPVPRTLRELLLGRPGAEPRRIEIYRGPW